MGDAPRPPLRPRVCLIIPPSTFLLDDRVFMSLGILKVAAALEQAGHLVDVLDLCGVDNHLDALRAYLSTAETRVYGITATTPQMPAVVPMTAVIRSLRPEARIILGGPHVTLVNAAKRRETASAAPDRATAAFNQLVQIADVLVAGDGEAAAVLACADNAAYELSAWPARHLVDVASYRYTIDDVPALSLITQLGCPFGCGFCGGRDSPVLRRVRRRTSDNVVAEIEHIYRTYGIRGFMLYDDELNVNPQLCQLMDRIATLQRRLGVEFRLRGFIKAELFTDAQAAAMRRAGFRWILTGFESGAARILTNIEKRASRADNTRCVEIARRHGLKIKALMSIGHPGESRATIRQTRDWLLQTAPDDFDISLITCYPGTPYYDRAVPHHSADRVYVYTQPKTGDRLYSYDVDYLTVADYYKGDPNGGYRAFVYTDALQSAELVEQRDRLEREVRGALGIPFNASRVAQRYEHSMGQPGLPPSILHPAQPSP